MAKFQSPLLGYNNNVRHKSRVFHIQTEDSGVNRPHIITHLFMDGGRILKSVKTSYAEHVGSEGMSETVKLMMKEQHKAMFIALRDGQFDHIVEGGDKRPSSKEAIAAQVPSPASGTTKVAAPATSPKAITPAPSAIAPKPVVAPPPVPARAGAAVKGSEPASAKAPVTPPPPSITASRMTTREIEAAPPVPSAPRMISDDDDDSFPLTKQKSSPSMPAVAAAPAARPIERSAAASLGDSAPYATHDLPPPPKNAFAAKEPGTGGAYRTIGATERPAPAAAKTARVSSEPPARATGEGRYAPSRPSSIFDAVARPAPTSIFSDELISDKSLDEVILSYLAEDLEPPRRK